MLQNTNFIFEQLKNEQIVPVEINNKVHPETHFSLSASSFSKSAVLQAKLQELKDIAPNAVIFSSFTIQKDICNFSIGSGDETVTADECDNNLLPEPLTSLFDYEAVNLEKALLKEHSLKLCTQYKEIYNQQCFNRLTEVTKTQSQSKIWNIHRARRITASNFHSVIHTRNSISPFNKLMQYETPPSNLPNLKYGRETEEIARESYYALVGPYHSNVAITKTGLHISANYPHLGASPDRITDCDCCLKGLVEIKCPRKYSTGLKGWENDKNFAIDSSKNVKKDHLYFVQMQQQMFLLGVKFCDFLCGHQ